MRLKPSGLWKQQQKKQTKNYTGSAFKALSSCHVVAIETK